MVERNNTYRRPMFNAIFEANNISELQTPPKQHDGFVCICYIGTNRYEWDPFKKVWYLTGSSPINPVG